MTEVQILNRLIVFEGIDGAGTTTQARLLVERIQSEGRSVWATSEPTKNAVGLLLRQVLSGAVSFVPETVAYLFAADRWEHVYGSGGIVEHHDAGHVIVCDRYFYSSLVYQSLQTRPQLVARLNAHFPLPGLVIFVDLDPVTGEQRLSARASREIYENEQFQKRVHASYVREMQAAEAHTNVATIAGSASEEDVHRNIWEAVRKSSILKT